MGELRLGSGGGGTSLLARLAEPLPEQQANEDLEPDQASPRVLAERAGVEAEGTKQETERRSFVSDGEVTVAAIAVEKKRGPMRFPTAAIPTARIGESTLVATTVEIALAES